MKDVVNVQITPRCIQITLVATFAVLSLLLAGIGIHGLLSFTVGQRSPEFGLRIALGAKSRQILSMVFKEGIVLASIGAICGLLLSYYAGHAIQALLVGVSPSDPATVAASVICHHRFGPRSRTGPTEPRPARAAGRLRAVPLVFGAGRSEQGM